MPQFWPFENQESRNVPDWDQKLRTVGEEIANRAPMFPIGNSRIQWQATRVRGASRQSGLGKKALSGVARRANAPSPGRPGGPDQRRQSEEQPPILTQRLPRGRLRAAG